MDFRLSGVMILRKASCLHEKSKFENILKNMIFSLVLVFLLQIKDQNGLKV